MDIVNDKAGAKEKLINELYPLSDSTHNILLGVFKGAFSDGLMLNVFDQKWIEVPKIQDGWRPSEWL